MMMVKFKSSTDNGYIKVAGAISKWLGDIQKKQQVEKRAPGEKISPAQASALIPSFSQRPSYLILLAASSLSTGSKVSDPTSQRSPDFDPASFSSTRYFNNVLFGEARH
jgi:hypothetical protein